LLSAAHSFVITRQDFRDLRLRQVAQPGSPVSSSNVACKSPRSPADEPQSGARFGLDDIFHHDFPGRFFTAIEMLSL
jgi:hypothetical protein